MSKVKYTDAPKDIADALSVAEAVEDFLPPPEYFTEILAKEKISLNIDSVTVRRFRAYAKKNGLKYQSLMNQVLSSYANKQL
jgi:uncharacterized protein (DUF4415 family)